MGEVTGKVWLVGAGPSDPALITIKGKRLLEQADVVVYDALIGHGILSMIGGDVRTIYVGKRSGRHSVTQEQISQILLKEALAGNRVVRLKGGDPFLFGRGGEELALLSEFHVPFEVVPGVSSALAVPAYGGIPVTHRDYSSSVHIITGQTKSDKPIDYASLARLEGTLVFLMGVAALEAICNGLLNGGMKPNTPAAILENGTTSKQRKLVTTLSQLNREAQDQEFSTPSVIVVGEVCKLSKQLSWAEDRPLGGVRVLVTRPRDRAFTLTQNLADLGAEVWELPSIVTKPITVNPPLDQALTQLSMYQWIVFTSPIGVTYFFERLLKTGRDIRSLSHAKFGAIGSATGTALKSHGIIPDYIPRTYSADALGLGLGQRVKPGERILLPRARNGSPELTLRLDRFRVCYEDVALYETKEEVSNFNLEIKSQLLDGAIDFITFTSASTVRSFANAMDGASLSSLRAICIGEQTGAEAHRYGMAAFIAEESTIESMIARIVALTQKATTIDQDDPV